MFTCISYLVWHFHPFFLHAVTFLHVLHLDVLKRQIEIETESKNSNILMYGYNAGQPMAIPIYTVLPYCVIQSLSPSILSSLSHTHTLSSSHTHSYQVYQKLEEISHFQMECYNYHSVPELQAYLLGFHPIPDEELHSKSHILEPRIRRYILEWT